jgi:glycosyltransferase involved in cell wall biosynthesis
MAQVVNRPSAQEEGEWDASSATQSPAVSIIIPTYNTTQYICEALDSVLAQTFQDYEIIVINDGSPDTDELERVLEPYRERIVYLKQENGGVSSARNAGLRAARGRLIVQLDPDDLWEPDYLAFQVEAMRNDPTVDVLYPNALIFGDTPDAGREFMDVCPSEGDVTFESLVTRRCTVIAYAIARREVFQRAGMYDESLRCSEDFDLWLRIVKQGGRIGYHRRVLARYRQRRGSHTSDPVWLYGNVLKVLDKAERTMTLTDAERETLERERLHYRAMLRLSEGKRAFFEGEIKAAIDNLAEANAFFRSRKTALVIWLLRFAPRLLLGAYSLRDRFILKTSTRF